jgi:uncharacterized membrane protein YphA (DoxX/SURF4 family)
MPSLSSPRIVFWLLQAFTSLFLAILFLQSGIDKVIDFRGNQGYFMKHFEKSPLRGVVTPMLIVMTIIEVSAGVLCAVGVLELLVLGLPRIAFWGIAVAALAFTSLFFGQRLAKDYTGAAILVPYFLLSLVGMWVTSRR